MNRYSAFCIILGIFCIFLGFLFPIFPALYFWLLGSLCLFSALVFEIWDVESRPDEFQDKKRAVHEWTGPSFGKETEGGSA